MVNKNPPINILFLSPLLEGAGNYTTAHRIYNEIKKSHNVILVDTYKTEIKDLELIIKQNDFDIAIGLHALHAGKLLINIKLPYALIMGGTDMYQHFGTENFEIMLKAIQMAKKVVAFSEENLIKTNKLCPGVLEKGVCIPQSIAVNDINNDFNIRVFLDLPQTTKLVLLPAGIRAVKDPFMLVDAFSKLHQSNTDFHLCIIGQILEPDFAKKHLEKIKSISGIQYINKLPRPKVLSAIQQADIVLNTSISEGMSSAILEAMALHTTVVARSNDGNESIIEHGKTGFIFNTASEAIELIKFILTDNKVLKEIDTNCQIYLDKNHSAKIEKSLYNKVIMELV